MPKSSRTVGVELEMNRPNQGDAEHLLRGLKLHPERLDDQPFNWRQSWRVKHDGSVPGFGTELVSPPFANIGAFRAAAKVMKACKENGARYSPSTGFHVHVDASGTSELERKLIYATYGMFHKNIINWHPKNRARNWCRCPQPDTSNGWNYNGETRPAVLAAKWEETQYQRLPINQICGNMSRYQAVNYRDAFNAHGTVEFREAGTPASDPDFVRKWAWWCRSFVESVLLLARKEEVNNTTTLAQWRAILKKNKFRIGDPHKRKYPSFRRVI